MYEYVPSFSEDCTTKSPIWSIKDVEAARAARFRHQEICYSYFHEPSYHIYAPVKPAKHHEKRPNVSYDACYLLSTRFQVTSHKRTIQSAFENDHGRPLLA
jgi:hypothetical protein